MGFLADKCVFSVLKREVLGDYNSFVCDDDDLDAFYHEDAFLQSYQLLCKNYCFTSNKDIICSFTLSNDSIKNLPNARKKKVEKPIPYEKHYSSYPAVMIGRLGVNVKYQNKNIGSEVLDFIKAWFLNPLNKTGCRFILVDSYNKEKNLIFYMHNGFDFLFGSEKQEREFRKISEENKLKTRLMYFDLFQLI